MADAAALAILLRKLEVRDALDDDERQALIDCSGESVTFPAGADLVREGDRPNTSLLVIEGWTSRYRDTPEGGRHITAIHVPGDFVDLHSLIIKEMDHSVGALSACRVVKFPHQRLVTLTQTHPHLTRMLWLMTLIDAAIHREWLSAAARSAPEQIAHLVCELYIRSTLVTPGDGGNAFTLPLTQTELGESLGLSAVHINRSLQQLRSEGLFTWQNQVLDILDWEGLRRRASFDARYLHLVREPR
jgi:CRP-like cAMP-binding protein